MNVKKSLALAATLMLAVACSSTSTTGDGGGGGNDGSTDGGTNPKDAAKDTQPADSQGSNMCPTPADVTNFMPGTQTPPHAKMNVCQSGDYTAYYDACFGAQATQTTCQNWQMAHQACLDCIESNATDLQWGAVILNGGVASVNVAGCLTLVGATACAKATSDVDQCLGAACDTQCPVTDDASFQLYQQCTSAAEKGGCKKYADAADSMCNADANPAIAQCSAADFKSLILKVGPVFCGP